MEYYLDYNLYFRFIEECAIKGRIGCDPNDPLMAELEEQTAKNDQFFYFGDLLEIKILFTSKQSMNMLGIDPKILTPYHFHQLTHPEDRKRLSLGRSLLMKSAQDIFLAGKGFRVLSTNFRVKNIEGNYVNMLRQLYFYFSNIPYPSVFVISVQTDISWFKFTPHGFHYYFGEDISKFSFPNQDLLMHDNIFSHREFEIIQLIYQGCSSQQIAEQLFLSIHTINAHRRNILEKSGKANIAELIHELLAQGRL